MTDEIQLVECPRDAMQGWEKPISTSNKIAYINALLKVGFHTIDFGSFVSPKLIPQMADSAEVVKKLDLSNTSSKLLAIVANLRGAAEAVQFDGIHYLGFPFSISPTFQQKNTNSSREESLVRVEEIQNLCLQNGRELVVYMSMGFGNPYGDEYSHEILAAWMQKVAELGVTILSIADTVGLATPSEVSGVFSSTIPLFSNVMVGAHLHASSFHHDEKLDAAFKAGCKRFDGAIGGIGGCPMADDVLVGNMNTVEIVSYLRTLDYCKNLDMDALENAVILSREIFS